MSQQLCLRHLPFREVHPIFTKGFEWFTFCGRKSRTRKFTRSSFLCARFYSRLQCSHCQLASPQHRIQVQLPRAQQRRAPQGLPRAQLEQTQPKQELHQRQEALQPQAPVPWERCKPPSREAPPAAAPRRLKERPVLQAARVR